MLRADTFTLSALYTIGCSSRLAGIYKAIVKCLRSELFIVKLHGINGFKYIRYGYAHRAAVCTVPAGGAANLLDIENFGSDLIHKGSFVVAKRLKTFKCSYVICHLF